MSKHTKGKWEIKNSFTYKTAIYAKGTGYIAFLPNTDGADHLKEEYIANARLIAAAPDLLEALKSIAEGCSFPEDEVQKAIRDRARQAIAKAEQEAPNE